MDNNDSLKTCISRAAPNGYFLEKGETCQSLFSKVQDDDLKCLVLSTTQIYLVYYYRSLNKPENIHISEVRIREFGHFLLKKLLQTQMEAYRPELMISWRTAVLKLELEVKLCISVEARSQQGWEHFVNLTGPPLSAISQTRPNILFSLSSLPDRISPVKAENYFSFSYESSLQICVTISNNKLKSWTQNVPMQPCTIIMSTWLLPFKCIIHCKKSPSSAHSLDTPLTAQTWTSTVCSLVK